MYCEPGWLMMGGWKPPPLSERWWSPPLEKGQPVLGRVNP